MAFGEADESSTNQLVIPPHLQPNYGSLYFQFRLDHHVLIFEETGYENGVSPRQVAKLFQTICAEESIRSKYGIVGVSVVQDSSSLDEIFALKKLKTLVIDYNAPNADQHDRFERVVEARLARQHIQRVTTKLEADFTGSIQADARTRAEAHFALSNGSVSAYGQNQADEKVRIASQATPLVASDRYDPDFVVAVNAFARAAGKYVTRFVALVRGKQKNGSVVE